MNIRFKVMFIFILVALAIWILYPINQKITLGLDLRGGIDLVYEVDTFELTRTVLETKARQLKQVLEKNSVAAAKFTEVKEENSFTVTIEDASQSNLAKAEGVMAVAEPAVLTKMENNKWKLTVDAEKLKASSKDAAGKAVEIIRNRIDQFGVKEPLISTMGEDRVRVQLPGENDVQKAVELIGSTAQLQFRMMKRMASSINDKVEEGEEIVRGVKEAQSDVFPYYVLDKEVLMTGDLLVDARPAFDESQKICVSMEFNSEGARKFAEVTTKHVGQNLAIVLDNMVQTAPRIIQPITAGRAQITGQFSDEIANKYAIILRAGALPAPIKKASAVLVGPTLGLDSITKGVWASVFGAIFVVVFMIVYYKFCGLVASLAVLLNILFLVAAMAIMKSTLTLPGIAGIALTLGMAVDANVLIFERIKDELKLGKTIRAAIEAGFERAFVAIWDSNLTTLISAVALYFYGTGPIKGFAVTLSIGIIISMFTAVFVVKVLLDLVISGRKVKSLSI